MSAGADRTADNPRILIKLGPGACSACAIIQRRTTYLPSGAVSQY
jgi:hypothetical protein